MGDGRVLEALDSLLHVVDAAADVHARENPALHQLLLQLLDSSSGLDVLTLKLGRKQGYPTTLPSTQPYWAALSSNLILKQQGNRHFLNWILDARWTSEKWISRCRYLDR